jgi:hypothetical protein
VKVSERVEADADAVWGLLRDFGGVDRYAQGLESCTLEGSGVGAVRTLRMAGGVQIQERLESLDDAGRRLSYAIVGESPLPVDDYLATIVVAEEDGGCRVEWSSTFEPRGIPVEKVAPLVEGIYRGGLAGIRKTLGA